MDRKQIIMHFSVPPSMEDIQVLASAAAETLPDELLGFCEGLAILVEDMPDETTQSELDLEDAYELLALFKSGKEIAPGILKKTANDDDVLVIFRRPLLDVWCETGEELDAIVRQVMIEELGRNFDFSDDEIEIMNRNYVRAV